MKYSFLQKDNKLILTPDNLDDLWILYNIIQEQDIISGKTVRRFRIENSKDSEKKTVFLKLSCEKKELDLDNDHLKITGKILDGSPAEYVDVGSYHTLDVEEGTTINIEKTVLLNYEKELLDSSKNSSVAPKLIAVVLDDESAIVSEINFGNYNILARIASKSKGKRYAVEEDKNYFKEIYEVISKLKFEFLICAGPGFEKEKILSYFKEKGIKNKIILVSLNSVEVNGILELIKSKSLSNVLQDFKISKDIEKMNFILSKISNDKKDLVYGEKNVYDFLNNQIFSISELIISTNYFNSNFMSLKPFFLKLTKNDSKIHLIDSNNDAGKILDGLGSIILELYFSQK